MRSFRESFEKSIGFRFLIVICIVLSASTCVLSVVLAIDEERALVDSLRAKAQALALYISKLSQEPLLAKDGVRLDAITNDANSDNELMYTLIYDAEGKLLTSQYAGVNFRSSRLDAILATLGKSAELPEVIDRIKKHEPVLEVSTPVMIDIKTIGTVTLGLSKHWVLIRVVRTVVFVVLLNVAVAVSLGFVLFSYSKRMILTPVEKLANAAEHLARGDLTTRVQESAKGEILVLMNSFNRMAEELARTTVSREFLDNIISSMMDALIVISPSGTIERVNGAACFLLSYREDELTGQPLENVFGGDSVKARSLLASVCEHGSLLAMEETCVAKSGRTIPVLLSASVLRDALHAAQGFVCVVHDITERKHFEARLKSYSDELTEANEEIRNFAYIVSHDLRAPLVNIRGFSEELKRSLGEIEPCFRKQLPLLEAGDRDKIAPILNNDVPEALSFIGSSVNRMDGLISSILKLSRTGRRKLNPEKIPVQDLIQGITETLAHQLESRKARMVESRLPEVVADRAALEQIFSNLLDNAVKYLDPSRPGEIEVSAEQTADEIVFRVRDNGRGMAKEDIPRAFEIFRRVGKQDVPGEGMGLAYVKTLVRLLGGRIWCESEPGAGTTFSFTIPA